MFRDKMKLLTTGLIALSLLLGELAFSVSGVAYAASQPATPVAATTLPAAARWVRCNVDGDWDADDWCWVAGARYFMGNGNYLGNGNYVLRNGRYIFLGNGRYLLRRNWMLPNGVVIRNGNLLRNGRVIGYTDYLGYPIYFIP